MDKVRIVVELDSGPSSSFREFDATIDAKFLGRKPGLYYMASLVEIPRDLWERYQRAEREFHELEAAIENVASPSAAGEPNA